MTKIERWPRGGGPAFCNAERTPLEPQMPSESGRRSALAEELRATVPREKAGGAVLRVRRRPGWMCPANS
eukprot:410908-Prymnesium_polylepis.1